jgi:hypothetical protein
VKNLVKDILNIFENIIDSNKELINELDLVRLNTTNYPNLKFDNDATKNDPVNKVLLDDLNKAAASVDVVATITTASSGHPDAGTDKSRHSKFIAVDIAILNGMGSNGASNSTNGNPEFRRLGNKLKDALVSMGYNWNSEVGHEKAVLWQTNTGGNHYNHLHVSNKTGLESVDPSVWNIGDESDPSDIFGSWSKDGKKSGELYRTDPLIGSLGSDFGKEVLKGLVKAVASESYKIEEQVKSTQIGRDCTQNYGEFFCLAKLNKKIYSPVDGTVVAFTNNPSCKNAITITFEEDDTKNFIQYCGIDTLKRAIGDKVDKGSLIGETESDFKVALYDSNKSKKKFKTPQTSKKSGTSPVHREDPLLGLLGSTLVAPLDVFKNKYDKEGNLIQKRWASPTDPEPADHTWFKKWSPTYPKKSNEGKIEEDIKKFKRLIK